MKLTRKYSKKYGWTVRLQQGGTVYEGIGKTFTEAMTQALRLTELCNA